MKKLTLTVLLIVTLSTTACSEQKINEWACGYEMGQIRCNNEIVDADTNKEYNKMKKYIEKPKR